MEILRTIALYAEVKGLTFLVIGGHALNAYGISRQTGDLDLAVSDGNKEEWKELFAKLNYVQFQDDERFARFSPATIAAWPIDLMYIDATTFAKLYSESQETAFGEASVRAVSPTHLAIMKLHALKSRDVERQAKDYGDLLALLRSGKILVPREELIKVITSYGPPKIVDRLKHDLEWESSDD